MQDAALLENAWRISMHSINVASENGYMVYEPWPDALSVIMASESYAQWASMHFTPAQLADPNVSGWFADPDLDDASNGQEYFQGTHPLLSNGNQVGATTLVTSDGMEIPNIVIQRSLLSSHVGYQLEVSTNLTEWIPIEITIYSRKAGCLASEETLIIGPKVVPLGRSGIFYRLVFGSP